VLGQKARGKRSSTKKEQALAQKRRACFFVRNARLAQGGAGSQGNPIRPIAGVSRSACATARGAVFCGERRLRGNYSKIWKLLQFPYEICYNKR